MDIQPITGEDYSVIYAPESVTVNFQGLLSLGGPTDYVPIAQLLDNVVAKEPPTMILNLKELEFLNSSGISMLTKFVIKMRKVEKTQIVVIGSEQMLWQRKSLKNLKRFLPNLTLKIE